MSDIGIFPPGAYVFFAALTMIVAGIAGAALCLLVAGYRSRLNARAFWRQRYFGYALGGLVSAAASGLTAWWLESSVTFGHWVEPTWRATLWVAALVALWPVVGHLWNRAPRRRL
jgi:hypothetical protein